MSDRHETYEELAVGWALHALEPEDEAVFLAHLAGCDRCAETVAATTEAMAAMASDLPPAVPSDGLRQRLRQAVEETEQVPLAAEPAVAPVSRPLVLPVPPERPRRRLLPALVAAAIAAVVGLGIWNVALNDERADLRSTVAEQDAAMAALLSPDRATLASLGDDGRAVATVVPRGDALEVVTHGLAANDADSTTYVVWGVGGDRPVPLGTFDVEGVQMSLHAVGSGLTGLDQYDEYAVSLEPGQEAPSEPTDVVATGQVTS